MLSANDLRNGTIFVHEKAPWVVLKYQSKVKGRGRGRVVVRVKNLKNKSVREFTFQSSEKFEEAEVERIKAEFLFRTREEAVFLVNKEKEFLDLEILGDQVNFLMKGMVAWLVKFEGKLVDVALPATVNLRIKETDPGVRGNSASNIYKAAVLETGLSVKVPLFVKQGEKVVISTETGEYKGRK
jgi:elongation factor P